MRLRELFLLFFIMLTAPVLGQANLDSLFTIWNNTSNSDSVRLRTMQRIAWDGYLYSQPDSAIYYAQLEYDLAEKSNNKVYMAKALNIQGLAYWILTDYSNALAFHNKGLKIREAIGNDKGIAASYNNIGLIENELGNYRAAIISYSNSLKIQEKIQDNRGMAASLNNIGLIYKKQGDLGRAMDYLEWSLRITKKINLERVMANVYNNMGEIYREQMDFTKALVNYNKSREIKVKIKDNKGLSSTYNNIGEVLKLRKNYDSALYYFNVSLDISREMGNIKAVSIALNNIGEVYVFKGKLDRGIALSKQGLKIAQQLGLATETKNAAFALYNNYKAKGNTKKALEMFEIYHQLVDSISSEENQKEILRQEFQYNYERKMAADSTTFIRQQEIKDLQIADQETQLRAERIHRMALYIGLLLVLILAGVLYRNSSLNRKANAIIEQQKEEVETQRDKIHLQNEELKNMFDEITELNNNLEGIVANRTKELKKSIEQLSQHHHDLAHHVRAPIASLIGLINLINDDRFDSNENTEVLRMLKGCSNDIDSVIKDISEKMNLFETQLDIKSNS